MKIFYLKTNTSQKAQVIDWCSNNLGSEGVRWWQDRDVYAKDGTTRLVIFLDLAEPGDETLFMLACGEYIV